MNLNEVKKHVIVQVLFYILIGLTFIISLIAILVTPAHASELKTTNITGTIKNTTNCGTQEWNHYCYGQGFTQPIWSKSQFGASEGYGVEFIAFDLSGITAYSSSPSTIEIYNAYNSFTNKQYRCYFSGSNQPVNCSVSRVNNGRINVNFTTSVGGNPQYLYIDIGSGQGGWDGIDGININKVMLLQTIDDPNENIIENANKNTDDIINNNNENTNVLWEAIHGVTNELINSCPNLISPNLFVTGLYAESNGQWVDKSNITTITNQNVANGSISFTSTEEWWGIADTFYIPISVDSYYLTFDTNITGAYFVDIYYYNSNKQYLSYSQSWNTGSYHFYPPANASYMRIGFSATGYGNFTISNLSLTGGPFTFCPYGSSTSKLDGLQGAIQGGLEDNLNKLEDIEDIQQDEYDFLTDNSDPTIDSTQVNNVLGLVSVNDPLIYLTTLPITLLNKINVALNGSCQDYTIGAFEDIGNADLSSYTFKFKCIDPSSFLGSSLWNTIDVIMGVGLLVLSIVKFYHAISNIISLGAENKVTKSFSYFSPMEFLGLIIEGDVPGVTISANRGVQG